MCTLLLVNRKKETKRGRHKQRKTERKKILKCERNKLIKQRRITEKERKRAEDVNYSVIVQCVAVSWLKRPFLSLQPLVVT